MLRSAVEVRDQLIEVVSCGDSTQVVRLEDSKLSF